MTHDPSNHDDQLRLADRIAYLIAGHLNGTLTEEESDELDNWITESDENLALFEKLTDEDNIEAAMHEFQRREKEKAEALAGLKAAIGATKETGFLQKMWPWLAAACVVAIGGIFFFLRPKNDTIPIEKPVVRQATKGDVQSGSDKAVLTLSDGRTIILDSAGKGAVASEGGINISKGPDGGLVYAGSEADNRFNTVSVPRGGQYKLVLEDGTKVWLNAESSLQFPAGFAAGERAVELKGEAYFEVAKDAAKPFRVAILTAEGNGGEVNVLGTHFNVKSYGEGPAEATLLEGSVRVIKDGAGKTLVPGQQAVLSAGIVVVKANTKEVTAWKEGKFLFRDAGIRSIGEQIKRWYDVDVEYKGTIAQHFNFEAARSVPLSKLLEGLAGTGQVHFTLNGRNLVIAP